jgi:hypothetical protein
MQSPNQNAAAGSDVRRIGKKTSSFLPYVLYTALYTGD